LNERIRLFQEDSYKTGVLDIDHDGNLDKVLLRDGGEKCQKRHTVKQMSYVYDDTFNLDERFYYQDKPDGIFGEPFYYRGRVYLLSGGKSTYSINEPRRNDEGVYRVRRQICKYLSKARFPNL
jgi:hypothetical protein